MKLIFLFSLLLSNLVFAKLKVITTTPDLAWLIEQVGGPRVEVESLLSGSEDPHFVDAMPSWIAKAADADIFCTVGMELEVGWVPKILSRSGNKNIQLGGKGYCEVGKFVKAMEIPQGKINRSMGDVHASGNPHYHLGPEAMKEAAKGLFEVLFMNDSQGLGEYTHFLKTTIQRIDRIKAKVNSILRSREQKNIMSYHREFSYFFRDFNLTHVGDIEETPGVPPSAGRIARTAIEAKAKNVDLVLAGRNNPKNLLEKFKEISGVPYKQVSISILKGDRPKNYEQLLVSLAMAIVESN